MTQLNSLYGDPYLLAIWWELGPWFIGYEWNPRGYGSTGVALASVERTPLHH